MAIQTDQLQRAILPIPDLPFTGTITYDAKDPVASFPQIEPLRPPSGAPNLEAAGLHEPAIVISIQQSPIEGTSIMPEKLAALQQLWLIEVSKYNVLPLDDRRAERFNSDIAGRPQLVRGDSQLLFGGMGQLSENSVVVKNKSFSVTAEVNIPERGANGVIIAQGGAFGEGRIERTVPMAFSADETTDVGRESGTPVSTDYDRLSSVFTGKVNWVQIDCGKDDHDHLISDDERLRLAMVRQQDEPWRQARGLSPPISRSNLRIRYSDATH